MSILFQNHTVNLSKNLAFYSFKYENFIVIGDFNAEMTNNYFEEICASLYNFKNLIKQPTYFKNLENPTRINHILTNHSKNFHSSSVFETGLTDFHKLTLTVLKVFHAKHKPKIIHYRDFNHFDNAISRADLFQELSPQNVQSREFEKFKYISSKVLNMHTPRRKNILDVTNLPS